MLPRSISRVRQRAVDIFYYRNIFRSKLVEKATRETHDAGPAFRLIPHHNVHHSRYFLELNIRLLRTINGGSPTVSERLLRGGQHVEQLSQRSRAGALAALSRDDSSRRSR